MTVCGIGMVNAALTTQNMIDEFQYLETIILSGIAGGVHDGYSIGDVLVPAKWANLQHQKFVRPLLNLAKEPTQTYADYDVDYPDTFYQMDGRFIGLMRSTASNFCNRSKATQEDQVPYQVGGAAIVNGFAIPMHVQVVQFTDELLESDIKAKFWFEVNPDMLAIIAQISEEGLILNSEGLDQIPIVNTSFAGASSDTYVDNKAYRREISRLFDVDVVDMESAAFMHVCETNQQECLVIRSVSNLAGTSIQQNQLEAFLGVAADNNAMVLDAFLSKL
eukprot:TRINITY_DN9632_c0_g2_i1.p1 TRINITY_DN9632_c0_g2~~TRINITY_DN9632_c0_g2_i1.p1  ORF type:complete len:277 (-),score=20.78 TRINITY_DN9632_c0_g2_i1:176-1006(-)